MQRRRGWMLVVPLVAVLGAACAEVSAEGTETQEPAHVEPVDGSEVARITLTEAAAERIALETAPVVDVGGRVAVPIDALIIDPQGRFWVYTSPEPLEFLRDEVTVEREEGLRAFVSGGPPVGTEVVTVGAQELYGAESGVGGH